jgi:hypothetical protein
MSAILDSLKICHDCQRARVTTMSRRAGLGDQVPQPLHQAEIRAGNPTTMHARAERSAKPGKRLGNGYAGSMPCERDHPRTTKRSPRRWVRGPGCTGRDHNDVEWPRSTQSIR